MYIRVILSLLFIATFYTYAVAASDLNSSDAAVGIEDEFDDEFDDEFEEYSEISDPLEGFNRSMTTFNDKLFDVVLEPVVFKGYRAIVSKPVRSSISNFYSNLYYPVSFVNNLLQLKFKEASDETIRFIVNTTFGIGGLFDPARNGLGIEPSVEDFGQTLGHYGVGSGFAIVLPLFGPTNVRDLGGSFVDFYIDPIFFVNLREYNIAQNQYEGWGAVTYKQLNRFSLYDQEYKSMRKDALDLYPYLRDSYELYRDRQIEE